jgi:hypothetical protein
MTMTRPCASVLGELPAGASLLGGAFDFCDAFFHVRETPEAPLPLCCVRVPGAPECEGRNTVIVARLLDAAGGERLVARYHNRSKMYHAEKVMMTDGALLGALRGLRGGGGGGSGGDGGGSLTVHISLQPYHHSSSTRETSCTRDLFEWFASELAPARVTLELVVAYPYRSHWEPARMARDELIELGARTLWGPRYHSKGIA